MQFSGGSSVGCVLFWLPDSCRRLSEVLPRCYLADCNPLHKFLKMCSVLLVSFRNCRKKCFFSAKSLLLFCRVKKMLYLCVVKERATRQPEQWRKIGKVMKYYTIVDSKFNYFDSTAAADNFLIDCFLDGCKKIDWTIYEKIEKGDEVTATANNNTYNLKTDKAGKLLYININNLGYKKIKVVERSGWFVKVQKTQIVTNDILYLISGLYKDIKDNFNLGIKIVHNIYEVAKTA